MIDHGRCAVCNADVHTRHLSWPSATGTTWRTVRSCSADSSHNHGNWGATR